MLVKGIFTQISGSVGGITGSHNRGGQYIRARTVPTDPSSFFQTAVRTILGNLANAWQTILTPAQRSAWDTYAANVPVINALGDSINLTGQQMYVRSNTPILQAGGARVDDGPTVMALGELAPVGLSVVGGGNTLSVSFDENDPWVGEDDAALLVYASREQSPSINFFKGPYRFASAVDGDSVTPPTSPASVTSPFPYASGNRAMIQVRAYRADGRLSAPQRVSALAS